MTPSAAGPNGPHQMVIKQAERELTELDLSRLAREITRELRPLETILEKLKIDSEQWERIKDNPFFEQRCIEEAQIWAGSTRANLRERISTKAAVMVEELLYEAVEMVQDKRIGGAARIQALQFIAKMGNLGDGASTKDDGSGRVTINILIGNKKISFDKDATVHEEPKIVEGEALHLTPGVHESDGTEGGQ